MIKLVAMNKRRRDLTHERCMDYWLTRHAPIACRLPKLRRYVINDIMKAVEGGESEFDGFAELWWESESDLQEALRSKAGEEDGRDLKNFLESSLVLLVREHEVV